MTINGKPIAIKKVDAATVQFVCARRLLRACPSCWPRCGASGTTRGSGATRWAASRPRTIMKQFHPKYASKADIDKKVAEVNVDSWVTLFKNRNNSCRQPGPAGGDALEDDLADQHADAAMLERNPVQRLGRHGGQPAPVHRPHPDDARREPRDHQPRGRSPASTTRRRGTSTSASCRCCWRTSRRATTGCTWIPRTRAPTSGCSATQSFEKDAEIAKWLSTREFRIALSHGIDRAADQRDLRARPRARRARRRRATGRLYFPGPEFKTLHAALRREEGQRDARQARARPRRTPRATGCGPTAAGGCRLALTTYVGFLPFTQDRRDDRRAVEEDRHPRRGAGAGARARHRAHARQRAPDLLRDPVGRRQHVRPHPAGSSRRTAACRPGRSTGPGTRAPAPRARRRRRGCAS